MKQHWHLVNLQHNVREEKLVSVLRLCVLAALSRPWYPLSFTAPLVQVDSVAHQVIISFNLANGSIQKGVEFGAGVVHTIATGARHEIVLKRDEVSFTQVCRRFFICMQHFSNHQFCQRVLVHTIGPLMDENIVEYLCETDNAVVKWNRRVEAEQS